MSYKATVYTSRYKSLASVVIETEKVRIETVPQLGAKLVSLFYKPAGKEWLVDSVHPRLNLMEYGDSFGDGDMSGWDECFPTVDACRMGDHEHGDLYLPDHGEVWSLPWDFLMDEGRVQCSVAGRRLPYKLTRLTEFTDVDTVRLSYKAENLGSASFPFMWVAHPQFGITEPTRVLLPGSMGNLACVYGGTDENDGSEFALPDRWILNAETNGTGKKYYCPHPVTEGWSGLMGEVSRNYITVTAASSKVPFWGIWIDQGLFNTRSVVALEPSIGYYDSLERAVANGTAVELNPGESFEWELILSLGQGEWAGPPAD